MLLARQPAAKRGFGDFEMEHSRIFHYLMPSANALDLVLPSCMFNISVYMYLRYDHVSHYHMNSSMINSSGQTIGSASLKSLGNGPRAVDDRAMKRKRLPTWLVRLVVV